MSFVVRSCYSISNNDSIKICYRKRMTLVGMYVSIPKFQTKWASYSGNKFKKIHYTGMVIPHLCIKIKKGMSNLTSPSLLKAEISIYIPVSFYARLETFFEITVPIINVNSFFCKPVVAFGIAIFFTFFFLLHHPTSLRGVRAHRTYFLFFYVTNVID